MWRARESSESRESEDDLRQAMGHISRPLACTLLGHSGSGSHTRAARCDWSWSRLHALLVGRWHAHVRLLALLDAQWLGARRAAHMAEDF